MTKVENIQHFVTQYDDQRLVVEVNEVAGRKSLRIGVQYEMNGEWKNDPCAGISVGISEGKLLLRAMQCLLSDTGEASVSLPPPPPPPPPKKYAHR